MPQVLTSMAIIGEEPVQAGLGWAIGPRTLCGQVLGGDPRRHGLDIGVGLIELAVTDNQCSCI